MGTTNLPSCSLFAFARFSPFGGRFVNEHGFLVKDILGNGGIPVPSRLASDDEFRALARVMARHGHSVTKATSGQRSTIPFMEELAELSGRR